MSYMNLKNLIKDEGYRNIKCTWYWNPKYSFSRGLRPLNCDSDVLKFAEDIKGFELVDVYVEHSIEVTPIEDDDYGGLNYVHDEVDSDVQIISNHDEAEVEVESEHVEAEVEDGSEHIEAEVEVRIDDDEDYIGSGGKISSSSHDDYKLNEHVVEGENVEQNVDLDWTTAIPCDEPGDKVRNYDKDDDSDMLHTPNESGSDEEHVEFPSFKSESSKLRLEAHHKPLHLHSHLNSSVL
ncbi:unnamed protein product [Vicia faba]|uniref:PB1-like domain-containing protein n=1 Tax=Vicia faba TaxID=3906 RepID=A0AAV1AYZ1_VICFA|nr:unnamed protein product [Vicia faba]